MFNLTMEKVKTIEIDAKGQILGRLAVNVANILREKDKAGFAPHLLPHQKVNVYNADKIRVTGTKLETKIYRRHSGYPGGLKEEPLKAVFQKDSREVVRRAVYGMLPKNKLRDKIIRNLTIFRGELQNNERK